MSTTMYERAQRATGIAADAAPEASTSAVSWAAIFAGALVAASASVILVALGSGLGFAAISPWSHSSLKTFAVSAGVWLIVVQWLASALGGYVTGRLRTRWVATHTHEVFFRDTAHGLVTWAFATLVVAGVTALASTAAVGAGVRAAAMGASDVAQNVSMGSEGAGGTAGSAVSDYEVDKLFRSEQPQASAANVRDASAEATRILARGVVDGTVSSEDRAYLAQLVAARSGISQSAAETRVNDVIGQVQAAELKIRQAADTARKAAAAASLCTALALVLGAFIACIAAALGGRQRDEVP